MLMKKNRELLDSSYQGVKRLFVLAYDNTKGNKVSVDSSEKFMLMQKVIIKFLLILLKNIFFQGLKLKTTILKLMEDIFMISQLMTRLSNTVKLKNRQDKVITTQHVVCWILLILKKIKVNCS